jgi:hypothetical protein
VRIDLYHTPPFGFARKILLSNEIPRLETKWAKKASVEA